MASPGKPVGNDLREGKVTRPLIYALEGGDPRGTVMVETVLREGRYDTVKAPEILEFIHREQGIKRALDKAQTFADRARSILQTFPESPYQRALSAVTDLMTDRDH